MAKDVAKTKDVKKTVGKYDTLEKSLHSPSVARIILIVLMVLVQAAIIALIIIFLNQYLKYYYIFSTIMAVAVALKIMFDDSNPAYKVTWIFAVFISPIIGTAVYIFLGSSLSSMGIYKGLKKPTDKMIDELSKEDNYAELLPDNSAKAQMHYLSTTIGCPAYKNTRVEFLTPGENKWECLKNELKKAEKFIFLEYFIVASGVMWEEILDILKQKMKEGVEVRVMWDDFGSIVVLPSKYSLYLDSLGIKNCVFNEVIPIISGLHNHRDHRKIVVIDGKVAFTGGINLADEYINVKEKHGHWKDASIMLEGEAVWSFTTMFLSTWNFVCKTDEDYRKYHHDFSGEMDESLGFVQPYYDSPLDNEQVGENVYLNMIARAEKYIYIESPYLVLDHEMVVTLCNAAKQGVDVRIIVPHIGDHWYVHSMTRTNYPKLIEAGVRIFEYTPGFIHSKVFICDDKLGTCGTVNMDYRSLYLHFECGALIYKSPVLEDMRRDFLEVQEVSHEVTADEANVSFIRKIGRAMLKVFSPMM